MRVPENESVHKEHSDVHREFTQAELQNARVLLRRLRFLEAQAKQRSPERAATGGALFAEMEASALEWVLGREGINFLAAKTGE